MTQHPRLFVFWILWVLLSGVGGAAGTALAVVSLFIMGKLVLFSFGIPQAIVLFLSLGIAQSLILRTRVSRLTWWTWPVSTAVFGVMGVIAGIVIFFLAFIAIDSTTWANGSGYFGIGNAQLIGVVLAGLSGGATLGFGQAIVLSDYIEGSGWLISVNAFAWALGLVFDVFLALAPPGVSWVVTRGASHSIDLSRLIVLGAVSIALIAAIQGAALVWLMHNDIRGKALSTQSEQPARLAEQK